VVGVILFCIGAVTSEFFTTIIGQKKETSIEIKKEETKEVTQ
jgi:hypothetical protein